MSPSIVYKQAYEITAKLSIFDVTIPELQAIALEAVSARNEATPLHPANAAGTYSYMEGVAALRMVFIQKEGWEITRYKGVEAVANKELGVVIMFQNVDFACGVHDPNPASDKGDGVAELVDNPTGYLWPHMEEEAKANENRHAWFFCVSCNGDEVKAELSRPRAIVKGNFGTFAERIFVIQDNDWSPIPDKASDDIEDTQEFDIPVSKKG
tara:strand:- start:2719 stop:3351 length:633 start_codon:yes stop_codon:yes gene_type:complete